MSRWTGRPVSGTKLQLDLTSTAHVPDAQQYRISWIGRETTYVRYGGNAPFALCHVACSQPLTGDLLSPDQPLPSKHRNTEGRHAAVGGCLLSQPRDDVTPEEEDITASDCFGVARVSTTLLPSTCDFHPVPLNTHTTVGKCPRRSSTAPNRRPYLLIVGVC